MKSRKEQVFALPPKGVSFALPSEDFPEELKKQVAKRMVSLEWNKYIDPELNNARRQLSDAFATAPESLIFTHGSDDAIDRVVSGMKPTFVLLPRGGYPGYSRSAASSGSRSLVYHPESTSDVLVGMLEGCVGTTLVFLCWPGNPLGNYDQLNGLREIVANSDRVVVDLTYLNPLTTEFVAILHGIIQAGACAAFSFSKTLGLASARLGGIVLPEGHHAVLSRGEHFPWTLFQLCALETALCSEPETKQLLARMVTNQKKVKAALISSIEEVGIPVRNADADSFLSVDLARLAGGVEVGTLKFPVGSKQYPSLDVLRLDVSQANVSWMQQVKAALT
ncbi:aminotransferase class I/II-fold pyridoxal phosphate-dependent enzyme [Salinibacterium sp. SWN248]|uniref:aminotransferase class I/II-fold pyridoxal phosphate-dependent enzyme n=1 Tax=Salinibacterium sp. SWN248 TaxID=2792056 RepID=UPI0018CD66CA|nr:aminotransferase class I/II-fold pyridoxal phosphate-dependent enzyme [Salinibacterium sp. SWN248]MBH0023926.1 aminotransferase class I/II-fold pyridoxal phosphate-dependent enzyme [Salinibacterium sp. SWN248]